MVLPTTARHSVAVFTTAVSVCRRSTWLVSLRPYFNLPPRPLEFRLALLRLELYCSKLGLRVKNHDLGRASSSSSAGREHPSGGVYMLWLDITRRLVQCRVSAPASVQAMMSASMHVCSDLAMKWFS
jgi:hypothetical protein